MPAGFWATIYGGGGTASIVGSTSSRSMMMDVRTYSKGKSLHNLRLLIFRCDWRAPVGRSRGFCQGAENVSPWSHHPLSRRDSSRAGNVSLPQAGRRQAAGRRPGDPGDRQPGRAVEGKPGNRRAPAATGLGTHRGLYSSRGDQRGGDCLAGLRRDPHGPARANWRCRANRHGRGFALSTRAPRRWSAISPTSCAAWPKPKDVRRPWPRPWPTRISRFIMFAI